MMNNNVWEKREFLQCQCLFVILFGWCLNRHNIWASLFFPLCWITIKYVYFTTQNPINHIKVAKLLFFGHSLNTKACFFSPVCTHRLLYCWNKYLALFLRYFLKNRAGCLWRDFYFARICYGPSWIAWNFWKLTSVFHTKCIC